MSGAPTLIASVQRALRLLDVVGSNARPLTAKALARATGEKLSTTYHLLATLVHEGYLVRSDGVYLLGGHVTALSTGLEPEKLRERVRPIQFVARNGGVSVGALAVSVAAPALESARRRSASLMRAAERISVDLAV